MAQAFNDAVITRDGLSLMAQAQAGIFQIEVTRVVAGDGEYSDDEKSAEALQYATALQSERNSYSINNAKIYDETSAKISTYITNSKSSGTTSTALVTEGYYINEVGLYAQAYGDSSTEVLICIAVTAGEHGDYLPAYDGTNPAKIVQEFYITFDSGVSITFDNDTTAFALQVDLDEANEEIEDAKDRLNAVEKVTAKGMQSGTYQAESSTSYSPSGSTVTIPATTVSVTFGSEYSSAPSVVLSQIGDSYDFGWHVSSVSTTGFVATSSKVSISSSSAYEFKPAFCWIAFGEA